MKKATRIATKVMTVAIAVMMIAGSTAFASELACNTRTNSECGEYTLLPLNTSSDGHGSAGGQGDVHWTVECGASSGSAASASETQVAGASRNTIDGFVDRLYSNTLNRAADEAGRAYWVELLSSKKCSGSEAANGFFSSQEFVNQNLNNEQFVTTLYTVFFGRTPDQAGLTYWVNQLNGGMTRAQVISGFTGSAEWAGICNQYGINA